MTKTKEQTTVFEYFRTSDVFINGKFKEYVDAMWTLNSIQESIVTRLVDLYAIAAVVGLREGWRLDDSPGEKRTIQMQQLRSALPTLEPIMKLVLMLDESRGLSAEDRVRSAFQVPKTREEHDAGMELFNSYARGGIEYMYEHLVTRVDVGADAEDYGDLRINNMVAFLEGIVGEPAEELGES